MTPFFECCVYCVKTFTNEQEYREHMASHARKNKPVAEPEDNKKVPEYAKVPDTDFSERQMDQEIQQSKEFIRKRRMLVKWGVEAATMSEAEVNERYKMETIKRKSQQKRG